jgi:imidazolonepropionase-like amidohydrolase
MEFDTLHHELRCLVTLGMSPNDAIRSATGVAADGLGQPNMGRITRGARADLLVVEGDPLSGLDVLRSPRAVFMHGRLLVGELPLYNPVQEAPDNA